MSDLLKLLDGSVDDVKAGLAGKSREDLAALRAAEKDGKARKGVLDALDDLLGNDNDSGDDDNGSGGEATGVEASGSVHQIVDDVDLSHPSVDSDPRANTTEDQNRIDFNDPRKDAQEVVAENLGINVDGDKADDAE